MLSDSLLENHKEDARVKGTPSGFTDGLSFLQDPAQMRKEDEDAEKKEIKFHNCE